MAGNSSKIRRVILLVVLSLLVLAALCLSVYFLMLPTFTLVTDPAYSEVFDPRMENTMRMSFLLKGVRLNVVNLDQADFQGSLFSEKLSSVRGKWVLLSPAVADFCVSQNLDVSALLEDSTVLALYGDSSCTLFDCTLVSAEETGWVRAARSIYAQIAKTSQNAALVYDSNVISYSQSIVANFPEGRLSVFADDDSDSFFAKNTKAELDRQRILIALCPYVSDIRNLTGSDETVRWVCDYRFILSFPSGQVYGIVRPDYDFILSMAKDVVKGDRIACLLEYVYEQL